MKIKDGCKGCNRHWDEMGEGECSKCHRCLDCHGKASIEYTCAWRHQSDTPARQSRREQGRRVWHEGAYTKAVTR